MLKKISSAFKKRFFNKILLIYAAISILCVFMLTRIIMQSFTNTMEKRELSLNRQILARVGSCIDRQYSNALNIYQRMYTVDQLTKMQAISFFSASEETNRDEAVASKTNISALFAESFQLEPDIFDITIKRYSDDSWYISETVQRVMREPFLAPATLSLGEGQGGGFSILKAHSPEYRNSLRSLDVRVYTLGAVVMSADLGKRLGEIYVDFNTEGVKDEYSEYANNLKGFILILTDSGDVVFDSSGRYYGERYPYFDELLSGKTELTLEQDSVVNTLRPARGDVIVAGVIPKADIYTVSSTVRQTVYLVSITCVLAMLALSYLSTVLMSRRIRVVTDAMKKLRRGDLSGRIPRGATEDELAEIAESFNAMCDDLQKYINKVYLAEIRQKNAELSALQSQINPHFLYNTLESIRMLAITKGAEDAGEMIHLLAALFRRAIRDEMIIPVRSEIEYCEMYLNLFKIRFGDRLVSTLDVEEGVRQYGIVKHLLQPAVENYIVHGFDPGRYDNKIAITGRQEGENIVFRITDNGKGADPERLEQLKESLGQADTGSNIGLPNVNERIKLIYGDKLGLDVASEPGKGFAVTYRLTAISVEDLKAHVQNRNS